MTKARDIASLAALGPATTTDNTIARYDGSTGKLIQSSSATLDDSGNATFSGNVTVGGGTLGYGNGSGGTVTQATSKSTAVTLNKPSGQITTAADALAAGASAAFTCFNSVVGNDPVTANLLFGFGNPVNYRCEVIQTSVGGFSIRLTNISGGSLSEALVIHFNVIKGSTT